MLFRSLWDSHCKLDNYIPESDTAFDCAEYDHYSDLDNHTHCTSTERALSVCVCVCV